MPSPYSAADLNTKPVFSGDDGNSNKYFGTNVAPGSNTLVADKFRVCKVPAGFVVTDAVVTVLAAFGATVTAGLTFDPIDGSTSVAFGGSTAVALGAITNGTVYGGAPVVLAKDSWATLLIAAVTTPATVGVAAVVINGEFLGAK